MRLLIYGTIIYLGPAETLFQEEYFVLMKKALRENGVLCTQVSQTNKAKEREIWLSEKIEIYSYKREETQCD